MIRPAASSAVAPSTSARDLVASQPTARVVGLDHFEAGVARTAPAQAVATGARTDAPDQQVFPSITQEQRVDLVHKFQERNGKSWDWADMDWTFTNVLPFIRKRGDMGPAIDVSPSQASATALEFVKKNADFLGVMPSALDGLSAQVERVEMPPHDNEFSYFVTLHGTQRQPGFEQFDSIEDKLELRVGIGKDGTARLFHQGGADFLTPQLNMNTQPKLESFDPKVTANVLGKKAFSYEFDHYAPYKTFFRAHALGEVGEGDIKSITPTIHKKPDSDLSKMTYTLGYDVTVEKEGGVQLHYIVDGATGEILDQPEPPYYAYIIWPDGTTTHGTSSTPVDNAQA